MKQRWLLICKDDDCNSTLSCGHYYHKDYINQKAENNIKCPYCQQDVEADIKGIQKIDWDKTSVRQKLSEGFHQEFKDKVNWCNISGNQTLSESFIKELQDKVCWIGISCGQTLSEAFIKEFQDRVVWHKISFHQELTKNFISEFQDRLNNSDSDISDENFL